MFSLLFATALADMALEAPELVCGGGWVVAAQPLATAVDVPPDTALAFLVPTCDEETSVLVTVQGRNDATPLFSEVVDLPDVLDTGSRIVELPDLDLLPDSTYDVTVEGTFIYGGYSFDTGSGSAEPFAAPEASFTVDWAEWYDGGFGSLYATVTTDLDAPLRIRSEEMGDLGHAFLSSDNGVTLANLPLTSATACFQPEVRDPTGTWHPLEPFCADFVELGPDPAGLGILGCSTTPAGVSLVLGLLPLGLLRRRR